MLLLPPLVPDDRALSSANDDDKISDDVNPDPFVNNNSATAVAAELEYRVRATAPEATGQY